MLLGFYNNNQVVQTTLPFGYAFHGWRAYVLKLEAGIMAVYRIQLKPITLLIILIKRDRKGSPSNSVVSTTKKICGLSYAIVTRKNPRNRTDGIPSEYSM